MRESLHKTLIIRFSSVGDIVLSSVLLRVLQQRFPHVQIDYVVKSEFAELVRYNPHVTNVLEFPRNGTFADLSVMRRRILATHYDLIVDIHDSLRSRYLCFGASNVVRINKRKLARFLLVTFKWNVYRYWGGSPGIAERYLEPVKNFGISNDGNGLDLFVPTEAVEAARAALIASGITPEQPLIGLCPSAKHNTKIWMKEHYAETGGILARRYNATVALFGSRDEEQRCNEIEGIIRAQNPATSVVNLAGRLGLLETAAAMDRCAIIITNDSGLMHLAAARKRKVVAVFGSTVREFGFFPYGTEDKVVENTSLECRPCSNIGLPECPKGHFKCMKEISVDRVIEAARALLEQ
jgi:heptosyltransferase-2